jgi:hypothetical protein
VTKCYPCQLGFVSKGEQRQERFRSEQARADFNEVFVEYESRAMLKRSIIDAHTAAAKSPFLDRYSLMYTKPQGGTPRSRPKVVDLVDSDDFETQVSPPVAAPRPAVSTEWDVDALKPKPYDLTPVEGNGFHADRNRSSYAIDPWENADDESTYVLCSMCSSWTRVLLHFLH